MVADENLREAGALGREIIEREDAVQAVEDAHLGSSERSVMDVSSFTSRDGARLLLTA